MKKYWVYGVSILFSLLVVIIPVLYYISKFGTSLSDRKDEWGQFGDFLNVFISIANLLIFVILTGVLHQIEEEREKENKILESAKTRLILIFKDIGGKWLCKNVGEGAALNVLMAYKDGDITKWKNPVKLYSFMSGEEFLIEWKIAVFQWRARYFDIHGNVFTSTCENDETKFDIGSNGLTEVENLALRYENVIGINFDNI